ncbi:MAG: GTPase Era [Candidatus Omnitrophica bacterium]|nr:GTPase Era [Candidatus Omnitrophota bacterium]
MPKKCGIVTIVGRPNTGKSTLLNTILKEKVAIVSSALQTTRNRLRGIFTEERGQIVFVDTPGMHITKYLLGKFMLREIQEALEGIDLVIHLVDTTRPPGKEENMLIDKLKNLKIPIILGLNKIDLRPVFFDDYIKLWEETKQKKAQDLIDELVLLPLSALRGVNVDKLIDTIFNLLPYREFLYPEDIISDFPQRLFIADIIREKLFLLMKEEIPHSIAVYVEELKERKNIFFIRAIILVERDSQKAMVIGKEGSVLKKIGQSARKELEELLEKKIYLETHVKVKPGWKEDPLILKELGYINNI